MPTRLLAALTAWTSVALLAATSLPGPAAGAAAAPRLVVPGSWAPVATPTSFPFAAAGYGAVSCVGPSFCMTVGSSSDIIGDTGQVAAAWNGTALAAVTTLASPAGDEGDSLNGVSCVSASWCMAVGNVQIAGNGENLIEQWNGRSWSLVPGPSISGTITGLDAVSCTSASFCAAVGSYDPAPMTSAPMVLVWNGSSWASVTPSGATGSLAFLDAVSCVGTWCQGVGAAGNDTLALSGSGTAWSVVATPDGAPGDELNGVSCTSPSLCTAVGVQNVLVAQQTLAEQWNGTAWSIQPLPGDAALTSAELSAVDCFGPTSCVAGGTGDLPGGTTYQNVIYAWDGSTWALQGTPAPATDDDDDVLGVACVANDDCLAVGYAGPELASLPEVLVATVYRPGYDEVASDGGLFSFGAPFFGSMGGKALNRPVVGMAMTPDGGGYWEVASDGGLFAFGDAPFYGSMGGLPLNAPIVAMVPTADGRGYYEVAADGGIFAFGDATFLGSMGGKPLNRPVVGIALTPDGGGYWEVASDGGLFAFGDAPFYGSMGGLPLNKPIVGMAATPAGGYYEVASDGGLFAFGGAAAPFLGSMGGKALNEPIVGMSVNPAGGYYEVASDGGLFSFATPFLGSMGGKALNEPIVGLGE